MKYVKVNTGLGDVWFSFTEKGLHSLEFPPGTCPEGGAGEKGLASEGQQQPAWLPFFIEALQAFLSGKEVDFTAFPVDYTGYSPFSVCILKETHLIPYGSVTSYGLLAEAAGKPRAGRAVGNCMNKNRLPLVIPCHRVIRAGGKLGGFGSGPHWKKILLELEGVPVTSQGFIDRPSAVCYD